jgi:mannose-6-phosphate isomerase-like protein (cupin superfamily)
MSYTVRNLREVEDIAPSAGFDSIQEARFARRALEAEETGLALHKIKPGQRGGAHRHEAAEEVYVVISGTGRISLDGEIVELKPMDAVRVHAKVARALEADDDGLEVLVFGPHQEGDGELLPELDLWNG